jgi:hypothetical protein
LAALSLSQSGQLVGIGSSFQQCLAARGVSRGLG